jgi:hypothetical protein
MKLNASWFPTLVGCETDSPGFPAVSGVPILMESLILAQDERWRRA